MCVLLINDTHGKVQKNKVECFWLRLHCVTSTSSLKSVTKSVTTDSPLHSLRSVLCLLFPGQPQVHELRGRDCFASWEMHSQLPHSQLPGRSRQVQRWAEQPCFFLSTLSIVDKFSNVFIPFYRLSLPQLLRLLLGALGIPVLLVSWWAPPAPGPVCGGLRGGSLPPGQHLPQ